MPDPALTLRGLDKHFGAHHAVRALDLEVQPGEFVTLLGPSGCGKTTTLNMIAGFIAPDAGHVHLAGRAVETLAAHRRNLGIVFQDYALFPHRTVAENIAFGLRMRHVPRAEIAARVKEAVQLVRLQGLEDRRPQQLSGGQRQRVALARALVVRPALLLLDEPLSNLDLKLREEMRSEISLLQRRLAIATVFVTHDQEEALTMSDRIAVMRAGQIEQLGTARAIYETPATAFVAGFIGSTNLLPVEPLAATGAGTRLRSPAGDVTLTIPPHLQGKPLLLTLRPERLKLAQPGAAPPGTPSWPATITRIVYLGARIETHLHWPDGSPATAITPNEFPHPWQPGDTVHTWFNPESAWLVEKPQGEPVRA